MLDGLNEMEALDITSEVPEGEALLTFCFTRDADTFSTVELAFFSRDDSSMVVTLDGTPTVLVSSTDVTALTETLAALLAE